MNPTKRRALLPLAALSLVLLLGVIGCSKTGKVTGNVTYAGEKVTAGTITFHPEKAGAKGVTVDIVDGKYTAPGVAAGSATVTVSTIESRKSFWAQEEARKKGGGGVGPGGALPGTGGGQGGGTAKDLSKKMKDQKTPEMPGKDEIEAKQNAAWDAIKDMIDVPEKYADPKTSGMTFDIKTGSQEIDIDLPKVEGFKPPKKGK
jgi:hypothetical protein